MIHVNVSNSWLFVFILPKDSAGKFIMPMDVEIESMKYIIVYDSSTHSLLDSGTEFFVL